MGILPRLFGAVNAIKTSRMHIKNILHFLKIGRSRLVGALINVSSDFLNWQI